MEERMKLVDELWAADIRYFRSWYKKEGEWLSVPHFCTTGLSTATRRTPSFSPSCSTVKKTQSLLQWWWEFHFEHQQIHVFCSKNSTLFNWIHLGGHLWIGKGGGQAERCHLKVFKDVSISRSRGTLQNILSWKNVINVVTQGRSRGRKGGPGGHCDSKTDSQPRSWLN